MISCLLCLMHEICFDDIDSFIVIQLHDIARPGKTTRPLTQTRPKFSNMGWKILGSGHIQVKLSNLNLNSVGFGLGLGSGRVKFGLTCVSRNFTIQFVIK